jgi:2-hydroxycyclohexanecarboxyl-CoA dehydrogenase
MVDSRGSGDLSGRSAIVTGGAGEIGSAIVEELCERGATVLFTDLDTARGRALEDRVRAAGHDIEFMPGDSTEKHEVDAAVHALYARAGAVDIAVAGVGWTQAHAFVEEDEAYWRRIIDINLMSAVFLTHAVLPHMIARERGRIVLVSSLAGRISRRERALYSAAKAGVIGFAKAIALEVAAVGITVNCVAPGATETQQMRDQGEANTRFALGGIPRARFATPRDQAHAVAFLALDGSAHITGQTLSVDGGATMV